MRWFLSVLFLSLGLLVSCGTSTVKQPVEQEQEVETQLPNSSDSIYPDDEKFVLETQPGRGND